MGQIKGSSCAQNSGLSIFVVVLQLNCCDTAPSAGKFPVLLSSRAQFVPTKQTEKCGIIAVDCIHTPVITCIMSFV